MQVCLPVKWLDLAYNLVKNHDGSSAFLVVDHDEEDMIAAKAPIGNIYSPGQPSFSQQYAWRLRLLSMEAHHLYILTSGTVKRMSAPLCSRPHSHAVLQSSPNSQPFSTGLRGGPHADLV